MGDTEHVDRIFAAWMERRSKGDALDPEDLLREHPDLAEVLRERLASHEASGGSDVGVTNVPSSASELLDHLTSGDRPSLSGGDEIARGGMGAILRVRDEVLNRDLAKKVILEDQGHEAEATAPAVRRFLEEAQVTAQLDHPGVVPVHELGVDEDGRLFFTMKLVKGRTLGTIWRLVKTGAEDWSRTRAIQLLIRVCDTLAFAHAKGVTHRDLKPANIMVGDYGEVYVMDWGLAKVGGGGNEGGEPLHSSLIMTGRMAPSQDPDSGELTRVGDILGTPHYISLEQAMGGEVDARTDIYAVGAMLYELLAGHAPYADIEDTARGALLAQTTQAPTPLEKCAPKQPPELIAITEKAMARDRALRYGSAEALGRDLRHFVEGRVVSAHRTGPLVELKKWIERNRLAAGTAAAALVALLGLSGLYVVSVARERDRAVLAESKAADRSRRARALALAGASAEAERRDFSRSLLLAREAVRLDENAATVSRLQAALLRPCEIAFFRGHERHVVRVRFSPDGARIVTASSDATARLWDLEGNETAVLRGHEGPLSDAAFAPDGARVVTASRDGTARVWGVDGRETAVLRGHGGPVTSASYAPNATQIVTASADRTARLWSVDGRERTVLRGHRAAVLDAGFSGDGAWIVTVSGRTPRLWDAQGREVAVLEGHEGRVVSAAFSPDSAYLVTASKDGTARVWDVAGREIAVLRGHTEALRSATFSPDGARIVTASEDDTARIWTAAGDEVAVLRAYDDEVWSAFYSSDGTRIATFSRGGSIGIWDAEGNETTALRGHQGWILSAAFSPDGSTIVSSSRDGTARLWAVQGDGMPVLRGHRGVVYAASFSPDGARILTASGDRTARLWGVDGRERRVLRGHEGAVLSAVFSGDGTRIATASADRTARIWDADGNELAVLRGHEGGVDGASFSRDGTRVVTGSRDRTARGLGPEGERARRPRQPRRHGAVGLVLAGRNAHPHGVGWGDGTPL